MQNDVPTGKDGLERNWAQKLMSTLIHFTDDQLTRSRLVLAVLGTSRHSVATLAGTATPRSEIAPLPLNAPLVRDVQHFLRGIWGRVRLMVGGTERSCQAIEDEDSVVVQLASWAGGNFRLMVWMLELFGGAKTVYDHESWRAGAASCLDVCSWTAEGPLRGIPRLFEQHDLMLLTALELDGKCCEVQ